MSKPIVRQFNKKYRDADCPDGVLCIIDTGPKNVDRYDVIYKEVYESNGTYFVTGIGMSARPTHPQGVGQHFELEVYKLRQYRDRMQKKYIKWSDLPEECKGVVRRDLAEMNDED